MASSYVQKVIRSVKKSNPHQPEFIQALEEVLHSLEPLFLKDPKYQQNGILERIVEPERQITVPRGMDGRQGPRAGEPRLPRPVQLRPRPLQGRLPLPPQRQPEHLEIPRL